MTENRQNNQLGDAVTMQPRTISSYFTFGQKFISPILWILFISIMALAPLIKVTRTSCKCGCELSAMDWLYLITWIIGMPFALWPLFRLKKARIDQGFLYISNYRKDISVSVNMIRSVKQTRWIGIHINYVTVHFRAPTEFGDNISFMPIEGYTFRSHPVVSELRRAAGIQ
jgi:hypothetical protein